MSNARKALGRALENKVAEIAAVAGLQAGVQPLSGVLPNYPNDVLIDADIASVLVECKVRSAEISGGEKYITINLGWLKKCIENLARLSKRVKRIGVVVFRAKRSQDLYVLMRYEDLLQLLKQE